MLHGLSPGGNFFGRTICNHINGQAMKAYWEKQHKMLLGIWNKINWESIRRAMQELPIHHQCWVAKYVSGHFATGKNMKWWQFHSLAQCPCCVTQLEDKVHILTCPDTHMQDLWDKSLLEADEGLA